jgi:prepilin signal peptidase PulO-like enzyme (type II secretory pathway)
MKLIVYNYEWADLLILSGFLIPIVICDIKQKKIPNLFVFLGAGLLFLKRCIVDTACLPVMVIDTMAAFIIIAAVWFLTKGKIGLGDAKLSAFIAMAIGLFGWFVALFVAALSGLLFALGSIKLKKSGFNDPLPFAPFLALGCVVSIVLKSSIFNFITGLV